MQLVNKRFVKSGLKIKHVPNGKIAVGMTDGSFGVFDEKGVFVKESLSMRGRRGQAIPLPDAVINPLYLDYDAVYFIIRRKIK